jgi:hypothetical protein
MGNVLEVQTCVPGKYNTVLPHLHIIKKSAHNQGKRSIQQHKIQVPLYYLPSLYSSDLTFSITICEHKPSPCTLKADTLHCM